MRALLLALAAALAAAAPARAQLYPPAWTPVAMNEWGGLNLLLDSSDIGADAQVARNVLTDGGYLEKRPGNTLLTTVLSGYGVQYVGDWVAQSGTRYLIAQASNTVYQTDFSAAPVAIGTVASGRRLDSVASYSKVYFADGSKPLWSWDATSTATVTGAPHCTYLAVKDTRIFCGNIPNEGTSRVRISSAGGANYWTVPADVGSVDNAPNVFDFTPDDGDSVQCLAATPWGVFVGKKYSSSMIKGTGNLTYELRLLDPKIGCVDQRSVQMVNGVLQWLSVDGVYGYDGAGPPAIISRKLDPLLRSLNFADATAREWVIDTQSQWQAGNLTASGAGAPISATIYTGAITPSSATFTETPSSAVFYGTCEGCGLDARGEIAFAGVTSTYTVRYDAAAVPGSDGWTVTGPNNITESVSGGTLTLAGAFPGAVGTQAALVYYNKSLSAAAGANKFLVARMAANVDHPHIITPSDGVAFAGFGPATAGNACVVRLTANAIRYGAGSVAVESYTANTYSTFTVVLSSANDAVSFWRNGVFVTSSTTSGCDTQTAAFGVSAQAPSLSGATFYAFVDFVYASTGVAHPGTSDIVSVATFTSRIFDTGFSTPTLGPINLSSFSVAGTVSPYTLRTSTSPNNDLWTDFQSFVPGHKPQFYTNRYVQYRGTWTATNLVAATPGSISTFAFAAATTGYYYSPVHFVGSNITSWGAFNVTDSAPEGSTLTYQVRAATYAFTDLTNIAWTTQVPNQDIGLSVSTPTYFQWRVLFALNSASSTAVNISRAQVAWNEGTIRTVASGVNDRRYFLCVAVSTSATVPDTCLVRQKTGEWVTWDGPSIGAMGLYNNQLVVGDGSTGSNVWQVMQEGVYTDDGEAIDSEWVTADFTNNAVFNEKILREMWVDAEAVVGSSLTVSYNVNKSSYYVSRTVGLDNGRSVNAAAYPQGLLQHGGVNGWVPLAKGYEVGKYLRLRFAHALNALYFRLNSYLLYLENKPRTTPAAVGNSLP
jgi:hypothetical protein